jgi:hypothetical protein
MSSAFNPPDSPPSHPLIPEGLATKLGKYGAPLVALLGFLVDVTGIDVDTTTLVGALGGLALIITTMAGRYAQAVAAYKSQPSVANVLGGVEHFLGV